jgi:RND family efflux transporter MFP subunit
MVERASAERDRWQSELDRITDLAARQAVTAKLVDETQSKFRAADAAGKEIAAKILSVEAKAREADALVEKAEADAAAAVAKLDVSLADKDRVSAMLNYSTLHAPFDGVVSARHVDTGHLVNANSQAKEPLLVIVRPETVRVFVDVPEVDAVFIAAGAEAQLRVPALAAEEFAGVVTRTTWVLDRATRTLRTEIDVPNADYRLRPGMYAYARLKVAERKDAIVIPKTAILSRAGQSYVWLVESDGTLTLQAIKTDLEANGKVEVLAGLESDKFLLGVNPSAFREGQKVEIVPATK